MPEPRPRRARFRTLREAEQTAVRVFCAGAVLALLGIALVVVMADNVCGLVGLCVGLGILLGGVVWLCYITEHVGEKRTCPRCGKQNSVLPDEHHFICISCGHVSILRE